MVACNIGGPFNVGLEANFTILTEIMATCERVHGAKPDIFVLSETKLQGRGLISALRNRFRGLPVELHGDLGPGMAAISTEPRAIRARGDDSMGPMGPGPGPPPPAPGAAPPHTDTARTPHQPTSTNTNNTTLDAPPVAPSRLPAHGHHRSLQMEAGVMIMRTNSSVSLERIDVDNNGVVAVAVTRPGYTPIAIVGLYNPPASSILNRPGASRGDTTRSAAILASASQIYTRCKASGTYGLVLMAGDLNMRIGTAGDSRETEDSNPLSRHRHREMSGLMGATGTRPAHGSPGHPRGYLTSKNVTDASTNTGHAEVDYILASPADLAGPAPLVRALERFTTFEDIRGTTLSHIPVAVRAHFKKTARQAPGTRLPPPLHKRIPYGDALWEGPMYGHVYHKTVPRIEALLDQEGATVDTVYSGLIASLTEGAAILARPPPPGPGQPDLRAAALQARAQTLQRERRAVQARLAALAPRGAQAPGSLPAAGASAGATTWTTAAPQPLPARGQQPDPPETDPAEAAALRAEAARLRRLAAEAHAAASSATAQERVARYQHLLIHDPSAGHKQMADVLDGTADAHAPASIPPDRIAAVFRQRGTQTDGIPPALKQGTAAHARFAGCLPRERTRGAGAALANPFTADEVFMALFSASAATPADKALPPCAAGGQPCVLCADIAARAACVRGGDPDHPPFKRSPCMHAGRAPGPDRLTADLLIFPRHPSPAQRAEDRMRLCAALARILSSWLVGGAPRAAGCWDVHTTAISKRATPGTVADPHDPAQYRGITVGNMFPKLFELLLTARITHWAIKEGVVSMDKQVGFIPTLGPDMAVLAYVETLKMAEAQGQDVYALYLDISGAYDNVHQAGLWRLLRHAGVPERLTRVLAGCFADRPTRVRCGKSLSKPFTTNKGTPQGSPLSPILWNIWFEPLLRYMEQQTPGGGLTLSQQAAPHAAASAAAEPAPPPPPAAPPPHPPPTGRPTLNVRTIAYADDGLVLNGTAAATQASLDALHQWSVDWNQTVNVKRGKTQVQIFRYSSGRSGQAAAPLPVPADPSFLFGPRGPGPPTHITTCTEYRYLGFPIHSNSAPGTSTNIAIGQRANNVARLVRQYLIYNKDIRRYASYAVKRHILQTLILSALTYPIPALLFSKDQPAYSRFEAAVREAARSILSLPSTGAPNLVLEAASTGIPTWPWVIVGRARLALAVLTSLFPTSPATRVFAYQAAAFPGQLSCSKDTPLFASTALRDMLTALGANAPAGHPRAGAGPPGEGGQRGTEQLAFLGKLLADVQQRTRMGPALKVARRRLTWTASCEQHRTTASARDHADRLRRECEALTPRPFPPLAHAADLLLLRTGDSTVAGLGTRAFATPMSALGAGGTASCIIGGSRARPHALCIVLLMAGSAALHRSPWRPVGSTSRRAVWLEPPEQCHLCGKANCSPQHIFCWCDHPRIADAQAAIAASAAVLVKRLCRLAVIAMRKQHPDKDKPPHQGGVLPVETAARAATGLVSDRAWSWRSNDGAASLYRLLLTTPWPASAARPAAGSGRRPPLMAALGAVFDNTTVRPHLQRDINTTWTDWAVSSVMAMARTWRDVNITALRDPGGPAHRALSWRLSGPAGPDRAADEHPALLPADANLDVLDPDSDSDSDDDPPAGPAPSNGGHAAPDGASLPGAPEQAPAAAPPAQVPASMNRVVEGHHLVVISADLDDIMDADRCIAEEPLDLYIDNAVHEHIANTWEEAAPRAEHGSVGAVLGPQLSAAGATAPGRAHCWGTHATDAITTGAYADARNYHHLSRCSATYSTVRWWLFPMLVDHHWALAVADPGRATIHYYDSYRYGALVVNGFINPLAAPDHRLRLIARWCERATADPTSWMDGGTNVPADNAPQQEWQIVRHIAPQQYDNTSCGAYVAAYASSIMAGTAWTCTHGQDTSARAAMHAALTALVVIDLVD